MSISEDLARIALQEQELQFASFDEETAWRLGSRLRSMAVERGFKIVIDVRRFGQPLFYTALAGTVPDNVDWVRRKSNVTARFLRSSYAIGLEMEREEVEPLRSLWACGERICEPWRVLSAAGAAGVIGSVTVSGLPQRADHELAVEAICAELGRDYLDLRLAG